MDNLEIKVVIEGKEILKVEGEVERDSQHIPISLKEPKYSYGGVMGTKLPGTLNLSQIYEEADLIGRRTGRNYKLLIELSHLQMQGE